MISTDPWVWIAAFFTLCCYSLLYGENKFFRLAEYTFVAAVVGHSLVVGLNTLRSRFAPLISGQQPLLIISLILGIMALFVAWPKYAWLASLPFSILIGVSTGLAMRATIYTDLIQNLNAVITETGKIFVGSPLDQLGYLVRVSFTLITMSYFLFTFVLKGPSNRVLQFLRDFGKYALLIWLGLAFGNEMIMYTGFATSSINRLIRQWLGFG